MRKPPFFATIFTLAGAAILCGLGIWQLQRLEWKTGLLDQIKRSERAPSRPLAINDFDTENQFRYGRVSGTFTGPAIPLGIRTYEGEPGYHLYRKLRLEEGGTVFVNLGWVAQGREDIKVPAHAEKLEGQIIPAPAPNWFTPENDPGESRYYRLNLKKSPDFIFRAEKPLHDVLVTEATKVRIHNNHLHYALFWFAMAGVLGVVFTLRFVLVKTRNL